MPVHPVPGESQSAPEAALVLRAATADITPEAGRPLGGYAARGDRGAVGRHDPLLATLICLGIGSDAVAWLTLDAVAVDAGLAGELRAGVGRALEIPAEHVLVCASHTHSGPSGWTGALHPSDAEEREGDLVAGLVDAVGALAVAAASAAEPVEAQWCLAATPGVAANRQGPEGPHDDRTGVLALRAPGSGAVRALLYDHAGHPTVLGPENMLWSADWPGAVRAVLGGALVAAAGFAEAAVGGGLAGFGEAAGGGPAGFGEAAADAAPSAFADSAGGAGQGAGAGPAGGAGPAAGARPAAGAGQGTGPGPFAGAGQAAGPGPFALAPARPPVIGFLQGPAGDASPRLLRRGRDFAEVARFGAVLAGPVLRALHDEARPLPPDAVARVLRDTVELPVRPRPTRDDAARDLAAAEAAWRPHADAPQTPEARIAATRLDGARRQVRLVEAELPESLALPISVVTFAGLAWVHLPVELTGGLAERILAAGPADATRVVGYSDGYFGYLPDAAAHRHGTYEALSSLFTPDSGERLVAAASALLAKAAS
ncbi:hypothetical protein [Streptomyces boninensis]|uniref:hypothetical protein n=1 Tax=Streptomyces boninensis TaxID=2039455 RepID=UPI003B213704